MRPSDVTNKAVEKGMEGEQLMLHRENDLSKAVDGQKTDEMKKNIAKVAAKINLMPAKQKAKVSSEVDAAKASFDAVQKAAADAAKAS